MKKIEEISLPLILWYEENKRDLPWRKNKEAYRIWISEIMLQQTRVEAVLPYYERFLETYPTLLDLANSEEEQLHKLWEGLGYYRRAQNMKKCAIQCCEQFDGKLPTTYDELCTLAGIGSYTAGAIASIAYNEKVAAVDGNVLRVFSRILCSEDDIGKEATKKKFQSLLLDYIPEGKSDVFNQAVMELGALICIPNGAPRCNICPVHTNCLAYLNGKVHTLPIKEKKKQRRIEKRCIVIVKKEHKIYLRKRSNQGLLAGLYEFINLEGTYTKKQLGALFPMFSTIQKAPSAKHVFSHVEWHMQGYFCESESWLDDGIWVDFEELETTYAIPSAFKVYKELLYETKGTNSKLSTKK